MSKVMLWMSSDAVRWIIGAPLRRVSQITPQLHLGGQYRKRGWPKLVKRGITAVVNLQAEFDDNSAGIAPARYLYLPTVDDETPTLEQLREGVTFIAKEIARGGSVYVHCHSGTGRAATMTAAYLTSTGLTPEKAWAFIRETRPFVCPTPAQAVQVELFARSVLDRAGA
ncbi:MAG: dual specificity protein phosphatase family protein [Anaerolineae bacterium]|nr:dual specificity protein phosphatase family protein [Anaerolineae bacterium]